jgi:uncharacterized protein YkwD
VTRFARRAAALAALATAALATAGALAGPASAAESKARPAVAVDRTAFENQVVDLTNQQRQAHGCPALRIDQRLVAAARTHSTDMIQQGYFSHTGADGSTFVLRETRAGYPRNGASAENIAWGFRTPQDVVTAWMNSAGHRANILNCGSIAVGVGLAYTDGGSAYWTQDFGRI